MKYTQHHFVRIKIHAMISFSCLLRYINDFKNTNLRLRRNGEYECGEDSSTVNSAAKLYKVGIIHYTGVWKE